MYLYIKNLNKKFKTKRTTIDIKLFLLLYSNLVICLWYLNIISLNIIDNTHDNQLIN